MTDFTRLSASVIAAAVQSGGRTAEDVARETLARIAGYDAVQPQTWITRTPEAEVLAQARQHTEAFVKLEVDAEDLRALWPAHP